METPFAFKINSLWQKKSVAMLIIYQRSGEDATRIVGYIWGYKDLLTHMRSPGGRVPPLMGLPEINPN